MHLCRTAEVYGSLNIYVDVILKKYVESTKVWKGAEICGSKSVASNLLTVLMCYMEYGIV